MDAPRTHGLDPPEIVALVDRAVGRDGDAFGALYDCYLTPVYRYLYVRTGHHADAEDLAEQVFFKAWEALPRFTWQGRPFLAWLYRLAHNALVDHLRRQRPTTSLTPTRDDGERPFDLASDVDGAAFAQRLDAQVLIAVIQQLTPDQQAVIALKFLEGRETAEIAEILDKREGTIRALQLRALLSLRRLLEAQGEVGMTAS
ncbi:MAG: sigma-70 family RNA polymerase sigma factor [Chloroflexi bacterium]|nr:sigma-70 family RNA polymerase sigma factor [Chloroflexota bacterium]